MKIKFSYKGVYTLLFSLLGGMVWLLVMPLTPRSESGSIEQEAPFAMVALQGLGDRQNSWAWSMQWWNGYLYVGTNRAWHCAEIAALHQVLPRLFPYPPSNPDVECTSEPEDLLLQAEIWRWAPTTGIWSRVYQSPNVVPIPGKPGKFVARDVGFRDMSVFTEPDGTEALYVSSVGPMFIWSGTPGARILRSSDGVNFEPVPQAPGTVLGDFPYSSIGRHATYQNRFYAIGGVIQGIGLLLEADNPASGNDAFQVVGPPGRIASVVAPYNDALYVGTHDPMDGYAVLKTKATGTRPYTYMTVVDRGGYLPRPWNQEALSMKVFDDRLYVGGNGVKPSIVGPSGSAELIRINPDDTWDIVVGHPRLTPDGWKFPLSGFGAGFGNFFNGHMWRMQVFDENLYVGTFDSSTLLEDDPVNGPLVSATMGGDLVRTSNGIDFFLITMDGFGDKFNFGVRTLQATPYGLFLGTTNYYYGLQIWHIPGTVEIPEFSRVFLPAVSRDSPSSPVLSAHPASSPYADAVSIPEAFVASTSLTPLSSPAIQPPELVQAEVISDTVVVSWEPVPDAQRYRVMRYAIEQVTLTITGATTLEAQIWTPAVEVGTSVDSFFADNDVDADAQYAYSIEAINDLGYSATSNIAPAPSRALTPTLYSLSAIIVDMQMRGYLTSEGNQEVVRTLDATRAFIENDNFADAARTLVDLRALLEQAEQTLMVSWKARDFAHFLARFERRIRLAQVGILDPSALN